jgi:aspartate/methionine/tyrosine aminotransferase
MQIRDFRLERYFGQYEFSVRHQLSPSDCESCTISELLEVAGQSQDSLLSLRLGYTETQGDPVLREAIAEHYEHCCADDVVVTNAPQEAIFLTMQAVLKPGDRVVVQTPCYQSLLEVAHSMGCNVVQWPAQETASGWQFDLDGLPQLLDGAQLLVLNAPHNPTGYQPSESERKHIAEIAQVAGTRLFSDEMYRGLEHDPTEALQPEAARSERAISLWGGSKSFGLPGLRIGWLVCRDHAVIDEVIRLKDYTTMCSSGPGEFLMLAGLKASQTLFARNRALIAENEARVRAFANARADDYTWRAPAAGPVGLLEVRNGLATELCDQLRCEADILAVPSTLFDMPDKHVRIGLGRAGVAKTMDQWEAWETRRRK